ncbi:MAG: SLBB domain-containing protein [Deltaproteobacteria bacterium]|nr:SLBB domain-containing protein [Deltaproteobacteria bacterium]
MSRRHLAEVQHEGLLQALIIAVALAACAAPPRAPYPLHPASRSATGGPVELLGAVAHPGAIPYAPGLTLRAALQLAGGATEDARGTITVRRRGMLFRVDLRALLAGETPDPELGPGDSITVDATIE